MDRSKCPELSFSKLVEITKRPAEQDGMLNSRLELDLDLAKTPLHVAVHQELLETASNFFYNALKANT